MSFTDALASTQYTRLRGYRYAANQYLSLCPNATVQSTTVSSVPSTPSYATLLLGAGVSANVREGMTVLVGDTSNQLVTARNPIFRGRVRAGSSGATLNINQTSAPIQAGHYLWVLDDFDIHEKLARDTGAVYYKDYFQTLHAPNPVITGLHSAYAGWCTGSVFVLAFAPGYLLPNPAASTISTWLWEVDDGTILIGSSSTQNVTVSFPYGHRWVHLTATDDAGRSTTFHFEVHAHHPTNYPPELDFSGAEISADLDSGYHASITGYAGISTVLNRTRCCIWSQEYHDGTETELYSRAGQVEFVGRLRNEANRATSDPTYAMLLQTDFTLEGPGDQLDRISMQPLALRNVSTADYWDELVTLTPWRAICHILDKHSTFLSLHSLTFSDSTDTYQQPYIGVDDGSMLSAVNGIAAHINAALEFAPDGRAQVVRDLAFAAQATRDGVTPTGNFTEEDGIDFDLDVDLVRITGLVNADGGTYNSMSGQITPLLAFAPGQAQGEGDAIGNLPGQFLPRNYSTPAAQLDLNFRVGQALANLNSRPRLTMTMPPAYHPFVPGRAALWTWTLDDAINVRGYSFTTGDTWRLIATSHRHDNASGGREVDHTYEYLGNAAPPGKEMSYPTPAQITPGLSTISPVSPFPSFPEIPDVWNPDGYPLPYSDANGLPAPTDGNTVLLWTDSDLWLSYNFARTATPQWLDRLPAAYTVKFAAFDPLTPGGGAYAMLYDSSGDNTYFYRTEGIFSDTQGWAQSGALPGEWDFFRLGATRGEMYVYRRDATGGGGGGDWEENWDFASSSGGWSPQISAYSGEPWGVYNAGTGWEVNCLDFSATITAQGLILERSFSAATLTQITVSYTATCGNLTEPVSDQFAIFLFNGGSPVDSVSQNCSSGSGTLQWSGSESIDEIQISIQVARNDDDECNGAGVCLSVSISGSGSNPFTPSGTALTRRSVDFGATFDLTVEVGSNPDLGGADCIPVGTVILAAAAAQVRTASAGGSYSDETNGSLTGVDPALILIPFKQFGGTTNNTGATPDYLLGSDGSDGGESLWKVSSGGGAVAITPTISANDGLAYTPHGAAMSLWTGNKIACLLKFGGTVHLVTSDDAGSSWDDRGALGSTSNMVTMRRGDRQALQLFVADSAAGPLYSPNFGATLTARAYPSSDEVKGISVYG